MALTPKKMSYKISNIDELINFIRENELSKTDLIKLLHSTIGCYFLFNIIDKELIIKKERCFKKISHEIVGVYLSM